MKWLNHAFVLILTVALLGLVLSQLLSAETPYGSVSGKLVTADRGNTLPGIRVLLVNVKGSTRPLGAMTDAQGNFTFRHVPVGEYTLAPRTNAHLAPTDIIKVIEGENTVANFELKPTDPFLRFIQSQSVFTTKEEPIFRIHGFTPETSLRVALYGISTSAAISSWRGYLPNSLTLHGRQLQFADLAGIPELKFLNSFNMTIDEKKRDNEGVFREEVKLKSLAPGMYLVAVSAGKLRRLGVITVTDLGIIVKSAGSKALVYAVNLDSGEATPGAAVEIRQNDRPIASGKTGADGLLTLDISKRGGGESMTVIGRSEDSIAVTNLYWSSSNGSSLTVYTYTDRPVYRPGHTVYFKTIARQLVRDDYHIPSGKKAAIRVTDYKDNLVYSGEETFSTFGSLDGSFILNEDALPGYYNISLSIDGNTYDSSFKVAEYRKPEYEVKVTTDRKRYTQGDEITANISAQYFYGAPVPEAAVTYYITRSLSWYYPESRDWDEDLYEGDQGGPDYGEGEIVNEGQGTTDGAGRLVIHFTPDTPPASNIDGNDWRYTIHATVTDASKRSEEGQGGALVTQGDFRMETTIEDGVVRPGEPVAVTVKAVDYDGNPVANARGTAELMAINWVEDKEETIKKSETAWRTDAQGNATVSMTPTEDGDFRIVFRSSDARGRRIVASQWLWVMSDEWASFNYPYQELEVTADKKLYHEGDTAEIIVNTKYSPVTALLTIEGPTLLEHRLIRLAGKSTIIKVKIRPDFMPAVKASVCFLKGKHFISGEAQLNVSRERKALQVKISSDKTTYQPGDKATFTVETLTDKGEPIRAEVAMGLVDESIYAIQPDDTENIITYFYPKRLYNVETSFSFPEVYLSGDDKVGGTIKTRSFFPDTAYWDPVIETGNGGKATVTVTLPDNLTTWRATARAATLDTRVGQSTYKIIVNKPFLVRLEAPRFFTQGDEVEIAGVLHNLTAQDVTAQAGLESNGLSIEGKTVTSTRVAAGKTRRVTWRVSADVLGNSTLRIWAKAGALDDAMQLTLPVQPKGRRRTTEQSGIVSGKTTIPLQVRADCIPGTQKLTLRLSPSIAASMLGSLDYLAQYPYGCAEQTMSAFLPDVVIAQMLDKLGIDNPSLRKRLPAMVKSGLLKLYGYQHDDGGWHWYEYDDTDPWMTAYVVYGLLQAREAGFTVNSQVLDQGISALTTLARDANQGDADTRMYMAYVLALAGRADTASEVIKPYRGEGGIARRDKLSDWGRSVLALTLAELGAPNEGRVVLDSVWAHFSQGDFDAYSYEDNRSNVETAAMLLSAACTLTPTDARLPDLAQWIITRRRGGNYWTSTRDTAFVLYAFSKYLLITKELQPDMDVTVSVNGKQVLRRHFSPEDVFKPEVELKVDAPNLPVGAVSVDIAKTGVGRLYYTAILEQYVSGDLFHPVNTSAGLSISRKYRKVAKQGRQAPPEDAPGETTFRVGDVIEVTLTLEARQKNYQYMMVEDPLPAGCEARDRGMLDYWEWDYWWSNQIVRDDMVAYAIRSLSADASGKNVHRIKYYIYALDAGAFTALPPRVFDMYDPATQAEGVAQTIIIKP